MININKLKQTFITASVRHYVVMLYNVEVLTVAAIQFASCILIDRL